MTQFRPRARSLAATLAAFLSSSWPAAASNGDVVPNGDWAPNVDPASGPLAGIAWETSLPAALERAKAEKKPLFLAVNMDGERANDRLAKSVYRDKAVIDLSAHAVCAVASKFEHGSAACARFGGLTCADHRSVDIAAREKILKGSSDGAVIAPQHVFLNGDGTVLFSVPYEIGAGELCWCLVQAVNALEPQTKLELPAGAHAPRRYLAGAVPAPAEKDAEEGEFPPLPRDEALALIEELKRGNLGRGGPDGWRSMVTKLNRLVRADEPEAIEFAKQYFQGRGTGRGGGRMTGSLVRVIGEVSPPSYWVVFEDLAKSGDDEIRAEVAVALEQLGAPESLKLVQEAMRKEKVPAFEKTWLRALGTTGAADKNAHKTLLAASKAKGSDVDRASALVALGWAHGDPAVTKALEQGLTAPVPAERRASAIGIAITRDRELLALLTEAKTREQDAKVKETLERAERVVGGGNLSELAADVAEVCDQQIPRRRLFGGGGAGADGAPGADGQDGQPGKDGKSGEDGKSGGDAKPGGDGKSGGDGKTGKPGGRGGRNGG